MTQMLTYDLQLDARLLLAICYVASHSLLTNTLHENGNFDALISFPKIFWRPSIPRTVVEEHGKHAPIKNI